MFENILGHEAQKKILMESLNKGNVSHSYLFFGSKGIGKSTIAKEFAKKILGVDILESSPDYKYISKREDKKDIIIEQIRKELIDDVYEAPISCDKKVYIIDDAELLNISAQNALLKTLEEPPRYVVIILISHNLSSFLPTIISRVNKISFSKLDNQLLKMYIKNNYNIEFKNEILRYIDGSIGLAVDIIDSNKLDILKKIDELFLYLKSKNFIKVTLSYKEIDFSIDGVLDYLEFLLFDNSLFSCTKFVEKAKIRLKNNGNYDIVIDSMILKIFDNIM